MPNWVANQLKVSGNPSVVLAFTLAVRGTGKYAKSALDFNQVIPCPQELYETESMGLPSEHPNRAAYEARCAANKAKYGYETWYEFCCEEWGTKWNACDAAIVDKETTNYVDYVFNTAWAPPTPVIVKMSKDWPSLLFKHMAVEEFGSFEPVLELYQNGVLLTTFGDEGKQAYHFN